MAYFRRHSPPSTMFAVHYDDGRVAYFVISGHGKANEDYLAAGIARERQEVGEIPPGTIVSVKRVR